MAASYGFHSEALSEYEEAALCYVREAPAKLLMDSPWQWNQPLPL